MRQGLAVDTWRGRAGTGGDGLGRATADRQVERRRGGDRRAASVEVYLDRGTPSLFHKWWGGLVSMAPALGRDGLK